ncbi:MAG: hypothetical protein K1W01_01705 [Muribaculaceae bacterium]
MSFASAFKRIFGLDSDDYSENIDTTAEDADVQVHTGADSGSDEPDDTPVPTVSAEMKAKIYEGAVALFNQALPDFLSRSVDPAAQQRLLAESIDKSVDQYLDSLMQQAEQYAEAKLRASVEASKRDAEQLRAEMQQLEQQRTSIREQQLSADRRRRAMADRVTDLEGQVERLEAEREQFELENKSLLNKLKVADIQPGVVDEMSKEIEELKQRLAQGESATDTAAAEEYERRIAEAAQAAEKEKAALQQTIDDLKQQAELSQGMYNDLQQQLSAEREAHKTDSDELAQARKLLEEVNEMQAQFAQVETIIRKRDERIEKLKASNKRLRDEVTAVKEQLAAVEGPNLFGYAEASAQAEAHADEEIKKVASEIAAIEDDFECPDWFVAEPGPNTASLRTDDSEFGYTEPPRKPHKPDSDAQLSLF